MDRFGDHRALSFDCYGTLIDWETGLLQSLQPWCAWRGLEPGPEDLLELYGRHESAVEAEHPALGYRDVLGESLRRVAASLGHDATDEECREFGASVGAWPAFADSAPALRRLKHRFRLVILSNVDRASFAASNRRLGVEFDLVVTAEDVGSYKPSHANFEALFAALPSIGTARSELLHVAQSLYHDHEPARALGLSSVWIDRRHGRQGPGATPAATVEVTHRYPSLTAFADALLAPVR